MIDCLIGDGHETEARMLMACKLEASRETFVVDPFGDENTIPGLVVRLLAPRSLYEPLQKTPGRDFFGTQNGPIIDAARRIKPLMFKELSVEAGLDMVSVRSADWRDEMLATTDAAEVNNQATGFKAPEVWQSLRFRSRAEVRIAEVLDAAGVMFLPNCKARIGSLDRRRNCEADFLVLLGGVWGVLEVDGPYHEGKACQDHQRDRAFHHHGAATVQRYEADRCRNDPRRPRLPRPLEKRAR